MEKKNNRKILEYFTCEKRFYTKDNDGAAAAKAQALFIHKHGKEEFFKLQNVMHKARDFKKIQEILGQNTQEGLHILEGFMKTEADVWRHFRFLNVFYKNTIILKWYFEVLFL